MKALFNKLRFAVLAVGAFCMCIVVSDLIASAAWQVPSSAPPQDNVYAPLNVGMNLQRKQGPLWVGPDTVEIGYALRLDGNLNLQGMSDNWNETNPSRATGTIHLVPAPFNNFGNAITFGASGAGATSTAQAGIYVKSGTGPDWTKMFFATTDDYANGPKTRMMIDSNGNIGIGTNNPGTYRLNVNGNTLVGNLEVLNAGDVCVQGTGKCLKTAATLDSGGSSAGDWCSYDGTQIICNEDDPGKVEAGTAEQFAYYDTSTNSVRGNAFISINGMTGYIEHSGTGYGMTQTAANHFFFDSNKGIQFQIDADDATDMTNDASTFQVNSNAGPSIFILDESGNVFTSGNITVGAGRNVCISGGQCLATAGYWSQSGSNLYPQDLAWNVGIGTNNPGAKLDINGQIKISGGTPGLGKVLTSDASGLASWQDLSAGASDHGALTGLADDDHSQYLLANGTRSMSGTLNMAAVGGENNINRINNLIGTNDLSLFGNVTESAPISYRASDHDFYTGGTQKMTIIANGNVGIGAANPTARLSVGNTSQFQVNDTGNILRINNIPYSWPAAQGAANSVLSNNGTGGLTWIPSTAASKFTRTAMKWGSGGYAGISEPGITLAQMSQCRDADGCSVTLNVRKWLWINTTYGQCMDWKYTNAYIDIKKIWYEGAFGNTVPAFISGSLNEWDFWDPVAESYTRYPNSPTIITSITAGATQLCAVYVNSAANIALGRPIFYASIPWAYPGICTDEYGFVSEDEIDCDVTFE